VDHPSQVWFNLIESFAVNVNDNVQTIGRRAPGDTKSYINIVSHCLEIFFPYEEKFNLNSIGIYYY